MKNTKLFDLKILEKQMSRSLEMLNRYFNSIQNYEVQPVVKPGFLRSKIRTDIPFEPVEFDEIVSEIEHSIIPNLVHWSHPCFFGYYPISINHTTITAEMISTALQTPNFNWNVSRVAHELEWLISDWTCKILDLPEEYLFANKGAGGIVNSVTEGGFLSVNLAKYKKNVELKLDPEDPRRLKFVAYYPESNKTWAHKILFLKDIHHQRILPVKYNNESKSYKINSEELSKVIKEDINANLIPFWYGSQLGSTDCGIFDNLEEIGPILKDNRIYLHVDAAYAGMYMCCPEYRVKGLEYSDSFVVNFGKCGFSGLIGAFMFVKDREGMAFSTGNIEAEIFNNEHGIDGIDYKDYTVGLGRRFTSLKIYILLKSFGVRGYQEYLRQMVDRGILFEKLILEDQMFELFCKRQLGLVCFRLKPPKGNSIKEYNDINFKLYEKLKEDTRDGFISFSSINGEKFLRFVSGNPLTEDEHIKKFCKKIFKITSNIMKETNSTLL